MSGKRVAGAAAQLVRKAGGTLDVAIVLGSGLADAALPRVDGVDVPYAKLHAPRMSGPGHPGVARCGTWAGKRVVAFAGRAHLYQGFAPHDVTFFVRVAAAAGARTIVLTNAAGGLDPALRHGDLMLVADHINATGVTPIAPDAPAPFVDMTGAYAPHLRALAQAAAGDVPLREGVYAGVRGPQYETPAEAQALRRLGADAVGMSTVLETIAARALGLDVLAISLITNVVGPGAPVTHGDVLATSRTAAPQLARTIDGVLRRL